jgi:hypothetical protein
MIGTLHVSTEIGHLQVPLKLSLELLHFVRKFGFEYILVYAPMCCGASVTLCWWVNSPAASCAAVLNVR